MMKSLVPVARVPLLATQEISGVEQLSEGEVVVLRHRNEGGRLHVHHRTPFRDSPFHSPPGFSKESVGRPRSPGDEIHTSFPQNVLHHLTRPLISVNDPSRRGVVKTRPLVSYRRVHDDHVTEIEFGPQGSRSSAGHDGSNTESPQLL